MSCSTFFFLCLLAAIGIWAFKVYLMIKHPEVYARMQKAEQERRLAEERRKALQAERARQYAGIGYLITRWWMGQ